ncbi:uncharacterized protein LAJ45_00747 [Morchella importuna]|uniref:uncharacterized protein n=1 Tax=Morchella importuna TaxID=1174673 RepID=UPI001E8DF76D|nr:uncharacterized protein LAJ45_00747 [Morchella importuna]KAH8155737.1 hypothetical protein LAJ45_00747 [Morchella importuna]
MVRGFPLMMVGLGLFSLCKLFYPCGRPSSSQVSYTINFCAQEILHISIEDTFILQKHPRKTATRKASEMATNEVTKDKQFTHLPRPDVGLCHMPRAHREHSQVSAFYSTELSDGLPSNTPQPMMHLSQIPTIGNCHTAACSNPCNVFFFFFGIPIWMEA